jgi:acetylornithine deacetylase/succinyl-diaminopimelate desuccinylase-like protein
MGFSPHGLFPRLCAVIGVLQRQLVGSSEEGWRLSGGSAFNAVPDTIIYTGERRNELARKLDELGFSYEQREIGLEVKGKAAHAMVPEEGINAIAHLCIALDAIGVESKATRFIAQEVGEDPYAARIFGDVDDDVSGKLKFNVGKIVIDDTEQISIDCRIPVTWSKSDIVAKLIAAATRYGLEYKEFDWLAPLYLPSDHFMIEVLMKVYRQYTGDDDLKPISLGGATYARAFDDCVCFGALLPGKLLTEHQPNERVVLSDLYKAMEIYAHAVYALTR